MAKRMTWIVCECAPEKPNGDTKIADPQGKRGRALCEKGIPG
jgi:hypothetical protein